WAGARPPSASARCSRQAAATTAPASAARTLKRCARFGARSMSGQGEQVVKGLDAVGEMRGRTLVADRYRPNLAAVLAHRLGADDAVLGPVAALDEDVGAYGLDQGDRRGVVEADHNVDRFQSRDHQHAVLLVVVGAVVALAEIADRA